MSSPPFCEMDDTILDDSDPDSVLLMRSFSKTDDIVAPRRMPTHKGSFIDRMIVVVDSRGLYRQPYLDNIEVVLVEIEGGWFIVANNSIDEYRVQELGPFPTYSEGFVYMTLVTNSC